MSPAADFGDVSGGAVAQRAEADVVGQLNKCPVVVRGSLDSWPQPASADGLGLSRIADLDQPRPRFLNSIKQHSLFAGGGERGLVVDDRARAAELERVGVERGT